MPIRGRRAERVDGVSPIGCAGVAVVGSQTIAPSPASRNGELQLAACRRHVRAGAPVTQIEPGPADKRVGAVAAEQPVVSVGAKQPVISRSTAHHIVAFQAEDGICAVEPRYHIVPGCSDEDIRAVCTNDGSDLSEVGWKKWTPKSE